jgi:hypothetical protein
MLTLDTFEQLLTPAGQQALAAAQELNLAPNTLLGDIALLRKEFAPNLAAAAVETVQLRRRARAKWSRADEMYWEREALEQATGEIVARHRAQRYAEHGGLIFDLCCSIGGDLLALAAVGDVLGVDRDPLRLAIAQANAAVYGVAKRVMVREGDVVAWEPVPGALVFFDPARRAGGRRRWSPNDYEPPLHTIERWLPHVAGLGVKVAPGIDYDALPYPCEVEIVSVAGDVKEACLWFGALRRGTRCATVLPAGVSLHDMMVPPVPAVTPLRYLYEPDGAVIRAHLVEQLAHVIGAAKIDDTIAFLTSETLAHTPFARAFAVLETLPFNLKRLRARLRELNVGQVVIKKRGSPLDPQQFAKQLRLEGTQTITVVLTRVLGQASVVLCQPVASQ